MQSNDMAEKVKVLIDGVEIEGLVACEEYVLEEGTIEVPEFSKIRIIKNGITKYAPLVLRYKIKRDSTTLKFVREWKSLNQIKDVVKIRCDASGTEFARTLFQGCECATYTEPAFDGASPTYAQIKVTVIPYEVIPMDAA